MFSSLDWLPTFVEIADGPKGEDLQKPGSFSLDQVLQTLQSTPKTNN